MKSFTQYFRENTGPEDPEILRARLDEISAIVQAARAALPPQDLLDNVFNKIENTIHGARDRFILPKRMGGS
jgi:hypothetical protein